MVAFRLSPARHAGMPHLRFAVTRYASSSILSKQDHGRQRRLLFMPPPRCDDIQEDTVGAGRVRC